MKGAHLAGLGVAGLGLLLGGHGFLNGDAAAYAAQGWSHDLWARPVHLLWTSVAVLLSPMGPALPRALDGVVAVAAGGIVATAREDRWLLCAAFVLPWCAFGEVDLPWIALLVWASRLRPSLSGLLTGLAVATSPTALLAVPWVAARRWSWLPLLGAGVAVVGLTALSEGDWWWGHRGVVHGQLAVGRSLGAWAASGVWVALLGRDRQLLWLLPLLLAPPDVPGWVLFGVAATDGIRVDRTWLRGLGLMGAIAGLWGLETRRARVAREHQQLLDIAAAHQEGQGYEGPWSWGARLGVVAAGRVDGLPFRPSRPLAGGHWPAPIVREVGLLPPGRPAVNGRSTLRVDAVGVVWVAPWWLDEASGLH